MPDGPLKLPCPQCGSVLKLPNRSALGKVGKCPGCGHRFTLEEPADDAVPLELAEPAAAAFPDLTEPKSAPRPPAGDAGPAPAAEGSAFDFAAAEPQPGVLKRRRRSKKRRRTPEIAVGVLSAIAVGYAGWALYPRFAGGRQAPRQAATEVREERAAAKAEQLSGYAAAMPGAEPIPLRAMPAGVSLLVHLHPTELWSDRWATVRQATGPLAPWAAGALEELTGYPPEAMRDCTVGWALGPRGSLPEACAVVTFAAPKGRTDLMASLPGRESAEFAAPLKLAAGRAYLPLTDPADPNAAVGLAVAPAAAAGELDPAAALTARSVEGLLPATDRRGPLTVLFQPLDLDLHRDTLLPEPVRPLADAVRLAFGDWCEAAAVGLGPAEADGGVTLTLAVRGTTDDVASTLGPTAAVKLGALPADLLAHVRTLAPATAGRRRLVGRLPAMVAAAVAARVGGAEGRVYRASAALPEAAGPNLALASLLTWDAALTGPPAAAVAATDAPEDTATLLERLDRPVLADFRRTPLQEAFASLAEQAGFAVELDGAAIRDAGMTRNMPQEFTLGTVPARDAVARILANHPKLAVVVDSPPGTLLVTTADAAAARGLTPLPLAPPAGGM